MIKFRLALLFVSIAGLLSGCQSVPANRPAVTSIPSTPPATALIITVDADMTEAEYQARRDELIAYLIDRGYIQNADDLVADSTTADRIIRATLGADGGFKLSVYNLDSEIAPTSTIASYSTYSIPASYYGDYYYYGFAPVPFYGYTSWPAYYPIYPTYPVCPPARPHVPYCAPNYSSWHNHHRVEPTLYVNCGFQSKPSTQWAWHQSYPTWQNKNYHNRGYTRGEQRNGSPVVAAERASRPATASNYNRSSSNTRTAERGDRDGRSHRPNSQSPRPDSRADRSDNRPTQVPTYAPVAGTSPTTPTVRTGPVPQNQRTAGRDNRTYRPATPATGTAPSAPVATVARPGGQGNRPQNTSYPRANTPENRNTTARTGSTDNRPRTSSPAGNNSPRTNVANNARPASAPSQHRESAPRNNPAPQNSAPAQSHSSPSPSTSQTSPSIRDSSTSRQQNER